MHALHSKKKENNLTYCLRFVFMAISLSLILIVSLVVFCRCSSQSFCEWSLNFTVQQPQHTLTSHCRSHDSCGGFGERIAGLVAGLFFAKAYGRSYYIDWPQLHEIFDIGDTGWTMAPEHLQQGMMSTNAVLQNDSAVLVGHNIRDFWGQSRALNLEKYNNVLLHSIYGPTVDLFSTFASFTDCTETEIYEAYLETYRSFFTESFRVSNKLLATTYSALQRPFSEIVNLVGEPSTTSVVYYFTTADAEIFNSLPLACITDEQIQQLVEVAEQERVDQNPMNLFFLSTCASSIDIVIRSTLLRAKFQNIYAPHIASTTYLTFLPTPLADDHAHLRALQEAARHWLVLREAAVLVCSWATFCLSAALLGSEEQVHYARFASGLAYVFPEELCVDKLC